jgi:hypothetical protein
MTREKDLPIVPPVAAPPNAPEGFQELLEAVLAVLRDHRPKGETKKKLDHLNAKKALALLTAAAYHLSRLPDDEFRKGILLEAASLLEALVRENEARQRTEVPSAPAGPIKRLH